MNTIKITNVPVPGFGKFDVFVTPETEALHGAYSQNAPYMYDALSKTRQRDLVRLARRARRNNQDVVDWTAL